MTTRRPPQRIRALTAEEIARLVALPCALVTIAAALLLGPPLGHALLGPGSMTFWERVPVHPQPVLHARYLIVLAGVVLFAATIVLAARRGLALPGRMIALLDAVAQAVVLALLVLCVLAQNDILLRARVLPVIRDRIFTWPTLVAAAGLVALALALPRRDGVRAGLARLARETPRRRLACALAATLFIALWLLSAVNTDNTAGAAQGANLIPWDMGETVAILDGRTPLVNFHAQYNQLLPYIPAATMAVLGGSMTVWTLTMTGLSGLVLLGAYGVFRRVVRSSALALALFLPFLATSFFVMHGPLQNRFSPAGIFSAWPMRYGGAYLLAWLTARHLDGAAPRRAWALCLAGGLVALNNPEFGGAALAGALVALGLTGAVRTRRAAARLLGAIAAGLLGAALLVSMLTLARAGALPRFGLVTEFPRLYGVHGWVLWRMTPLGMHFILFMTFVAAIAAGVVRALRPDEDTLLTGMLGWSGIFGLGAGSYFVGRPDPLNLITLFSAWSFALALLTVVALRGLAARGWRRPTPLQLAVLFGFALLVCSLPQVPMPWSQAARLRHTTPAPVFRPPDAMRLVARTTRPGEKVAILIALGHRIAHDVGRVNVAPYASIESMPTREQMETTIRVMRKEGVRKLYTSSALLPDTINMLVRAGFKPRTGRNGYSLLVDTRP